jgi:Zn-dependent protease with chaperone function
MGFIKALALLVAIPMFGFLVSIWVLSDINKDIANEGIDFSARELCSPQMLAQSPDFKPFCNEVAPIFWMQTGSVISAVVAVLLLLSFTFFASIAGKDRTKVAKVFPPLVSVTLVVLAVLVVVQGAILTYGAYLAESYAIQRVHYYLIGGIGLGALIGGLSLIASSSKLGKKQVHSVLGKKLDPGEHRKLFSLVKEISQVLGSKNPEHIVVGLEPNFYVTSADVNLVGDGSSLKGETLYLSMPLARILTLEELKGIIGHELGHFRGADTFYTLKFSPIYSGLSHAVEAMGGENSSIAKLPALAVLSYIMDVFHTNVSSISREREFEADKAASEVADPKALASSLLKIGLYASAWSHLEGRVVDRLAEGKITRNLSQLFASIVKYDVNENTIPEVIDSIAQQTISHPTDSHPPTANRITELGLNIDDIERDLLVMPEKSCIELFDNPRELEEELTTFQQQYYVALGAVEVPDEASSNVGNTVIAAFGAHMVVADGVIEPREIDEAESIGMSIAPDFDNIEFREYCHYPDSIPSIVDLLEASAGVSDEVKQLIFDYLEQIAGSDDDVSQEETQLLDQVKLSFTL